MDEVDPLLGCIGRVPSLSASPSCALWLGTCDHDTDLEVQTDTGLAKPPLTAQPSLLRQRHPWPSHLKVSQCRFSWMVRLVLFRKLSILVVGWKVFKTTVLKNIYCIPVIYCWYRDTHTTNLYLNKNTLPRINGVPKHPPSYFWTDSNTYMKLSSLAPKLEFG